MTKMHRRFVGWAVLALLAGALAFVAAGCGGSSDSSGNGGGGKAATQIAGLGSTLDEIKQKGKDEGEVDLVIWPGYADKAWAREFTVWTGREGGARGGRPT